MNTGNVIPAYNVPLGHHVRMTHREAAAKRPGVLTKVGMETFVDPLHEGVRDECQGSRRPRIVRRVNFAGEDWLFFPTITPQVAIIRATVADEARKPLRYEHEVVGFFGPPDHALSVRNNGGVVK